MLSLMATNIPPSLNWLVKKRQRIHGELLSIQKTIDQLIYKKTVYAEQLKEDLKAIDHTITLHEIPVEPDKIHPVIPYKKQTTLKYGQMTRLIYKRLGEAGDEGCTAYQLADYIVINGELDPPSREQYLKLCKNVRYRLKNMVREGKLTTRFVGTLKAWVMD